ncbi:MAG: hypothetical protein U5K75_03865 [Ahrensia sp.]|nr:hypothetical protein [Ahrensia sp.]
MHFASNFDFDFDAAIERNRQALLRMVGYWLIAASMFGVGKMLPPRLSRWASRLLYKFEKATFYLGIAHAKRRGLDKTIAADVLQRGGFCGHDMIHSRLTIAMVRRRLTAVQIALLDLRNYAESLVNMARRRNLGSFCASLAFDAFNASDACFSHAHRWHFRRFKIHHF